MNVRNTLWLLAVWFVSVTMVACSESSSSSGDEDITESDQATGSETDRNGEDNSVWSTVLVCDDLDFGAVILGQAVIKGCKMAIEGMDTVIIKDIDRSSTTTPEYSIDAILDDQGGELSLPFPLRASENVFIQVRYQPVDQGTDEGTILVTSDSRFNPVQGIGVFSRIEGESKLSVPESLDFGSTSTRETKTLSLEIANLGEGGGNRTLAVTSITFSRNSGSFSLDNGSCAASKEHPILIGQGMSHSCEVRFAPLAEGETSAKISVDSDATSGEPLANVNLSGVGVTPTLTLEPATIDFGLTETGASSYRTLILANRGSAPVRIASHAFPPGAQAFSLLAPNNRLVNKTLEPEETLPMDLLFEPTESKNYECQLTFETDSAFEPQVSLPLTGEGIKPGSSLVLNVHDLEGEPIWGALVITYDGEELGATDILGRLLIAVNAGDDFVIVVDGANAIDGPYSTQYRQVTSICGCASAILQRLYPNTAQSARTGRITSWDAPGSVLRFDPESIDWPESEEDSEESLYLQKAYAPALPWPLPNGMSSVVSVIVGPDEVQFTEPVTLEFPNNTDLSPGSRLSLVRFSKEELEWKPVATLELTDESDRWVSVEGGLQSSGTFALLDTSLAYTINGLVMERSEDGFVSPVEGAWVVYNNVSAKTNAAGRYQLANVLGIPGTTAGHLYTYRGNTWERSENRLSETFRWPPSNSSPFELPTIEFACQPQKGFARGWTIDEQGLPVERASLRINCENDVVLLQSSNADGSFAFSDVPVDLECTLTARHPDSTVSYTVDFEVDDAEIVYDFGEIPLPFGDATSPEIETAYPTNGQRDVDPLDSVWLRFNEPVDIETPDDVFGLYKNETPVPGHAILDENGRTLRFLPQQALLEGREYRWRLVEGVADLAGNVLESGAEAVFRTPRPECPEPQNSCREIAYDWVEETCAETVFPDNTLCDDGQPCTDNDRCIAGECRSGAVNTCSGHGTCQTDSGECLCDEHFAGERCNRCEDGYTGYPTCLTAVDGDEDEAEEDESPEIEDEDESPFWLLAYDHGEGSLSSFDGIATYTGESLLAWGTNRETGDARILRGEISQRDFTWIAASRIVSGADSFHLLDACFMTATTGLAVGKGTMGEESTPSLYRFHDGGELWEARVLAGNPQCTAVECVSDRNCWAGCESGSVFRSRDGGDTWSSLSLPSGNLHLARLEFLNASQGWVFADRESLNENEERQIDPYGTIWVTPDGGDTWSPVRQGWSVLFLEAQFLDGQDGYVLVRNDINEPGTDELQRTNDGGWSWSPVEVPTEVTTSEGVLPVRALYDFHFEALERGWLAGSAGDDNSRVPLLLFTEDAGNHWEIADIHTLDDAPVQVESIRALAFADALHGVAAGDGPSLFAYGFHQDMPDGDEDEEEIEVEEEEVFTCEPGTVECGFSEGIPTVLRCNENGNGIETPVLCDENHPDFTGQLPECYEITCTPGLGTDTGCHFEFQSGRSCTPANPCIVEGSCSKLMGMDLCGGHTRECHDDNDCTQDSCDPYAGNEEDPCVFTPLPIGSSCNDFDACTEEDSCRNGVCVGEAIEGCCPGHPDMVELSPYNYCIDRYENTLGDHPACDDETTLYGQSPSSFPPDFHEFFPPDVNPDPSMDEEFPAYSPSMELYACSLPGVLPSAWLTWRQASRACMNQGKRLCHYEEWNYGCGEGDSYPYGNTFIEGRCADRTAVPSGGESLPTASRVDDPYYCSWTSENETYQTFDASGNVAEWILPENETDPRACGGSFQDLDTESLSCVSCSFYGASDAVEEIGFRCCIDLEGLCALETCNGHGTCDPQTGECNCLERYDGEHCDACATGYENYPDCQEIPRPLLQVEPEIPETGVDFGEQLVDSVSEETILVLSNAGTAVLSIESIEITGESPQAFRLSPDVSELDFPILLSSDTQDEFQLALTFAPDISGTRKATLQIHSNDAENETKSVSLRGLGTDCPLTYHLCGDTCVSNLDQAHCGDRCEPCPLVDHAQPTCDGVSCGYHCDNDYADCNDESSDGCETYLLDDPAHCGSCSPCDLAHVTDHSCINGICGVVTCENDWDDCAPEAEGCETDITSNRLHCSGCNLACEPPLADWATYHIRYLHCIESECVTECNLGYLDCDPQEIGCETFPSMDPEHCGSCENDCGELSWSHVEDYTCQQGMCRLVSCEEGYENCDENEETGCETDVYGHPQVGSEADPAHCGGCDQACNLTHTLEHRCVEGECEVETCEEGWADCNGRAFDGCETSTTANLEHCGICNMRCEDLDWPHVDSYSCEDGACQANTCLFGYDDCLTGSENPGCETDIRNSENGEHCGNCSTNCADLPRSCGENCHVEQYNCYAAQCKIFACETDWADCDGNIDTGCEVHLPTDARNCGGCPDDPGYKDCTRNSWYKVSEYQCIDSECEILTCSGGWADCDELRTTGCETDLLNDSNNCGGCSDENNNWAYRCAYDNANYECLDGECRLLSCYEDYDDCDEESSNGCERYLPDNDDGWHCGSCNRHCYDLTEACENGDCHVSAYACVDSQCDITRCEGDYYNCDDNDRNGCEIDTGTDPANCGGCSNACLASDFEGALEVTCIERECVPSACEVPLSVADGQCQCIGDGNCECDGYEVDQTWQKAVFLSEYSAQQHSICPAGDYDWYEIYVSSSSSYAIFSAQLSGTGWTSTETPVLSLYDDPTDTPLVSAQAEDDWEIDELLFPGFYYLKVENSQAEYSISNYTIDWNATDYPF